VGISISSKVKKGLSWKPSVGVAEGRERIDE
jgi:hypothetical protein